MAIAPVAHATAAGPNSATTPAQDTSTANLIVLSALTGPLAVGPAVQDSNHNIWTPLNGNRGGGFFWNQFFYCINPVVGPGHTFTINDAGGFGSIQMTAWSGAAGGFDLQGADFGGSTTQPLTPSVNGCLVVASYVGSNDITSVNLPFALSDTEPFTGGVNYASGTAFVIQTTAILAQCTFNGVGSGGPLSIASFKPSATATTITPPAGALATATFAPLLTDTITPGAAALAIATFAPALIGGLLVPTGALSLQGFAPALTRTIPVPAGALTLATFAPLLGEVVGPVPPAHLVLTTYAPKLVFSFGPAAGNHAAAWWWSGAAARMINDAGFQLLVEPHLQNENYTGEPQPDEGAP